MERFVIQALSPDKMKQLEVLLLLEFDVRFLNKKLCLQLIRKMIKFAREGS